MEGDSASSTASPLPPPFPTLQDMPLSHRQTRRFVVVFFGLLLLLAIVSTVLITRGWADEDLQEQVRDMEAWDEARQP